MANSKNNSSNISKQIGYALSIASLAPSVHNIQPWRVEVSENIVKIIPKTDILTAGDPTGRQTYISLGAFVETLIIALKEYGISVDAITADKEAVSVILSEKSLNKTKDELFNAVPRRHTNRSVFEQDKLPDNDIDELLNVRISQTIDPTIICKQIISTKDTDIEHYATLIAKGIKIPMLSREFCGELSQYITKDSKFGIPYRSMNSPIPYRIFTYLLKHNHLANYISRQEYRNWRSAPVILSIFTNGDSYKHWIEAGRLYQRCCLKATALGWDNSTSATLVEALNFHEDIEGMMGTNLRLMTTVRIGKASKPSTPSGRYSAKELQAS